MTILITGKAGTGKTFLTNRLKNLHKDWYFTAMTNQAASLINGKTIHKHFGFTLENPWFNDYTKPSTKAAHVIIDEASQLSQEKLEQLVRARPKQNFILVGDFNQLLPVDGSPIKKDWIDEVYELTDIHRTTDSRLLTFLDGILHGEVDWRVITNRQTKHTDYNTLFITFENDAIDEYNKLFSLVNGTPVKGRDWKFGTDHKTKISWRNKTETRFNTAAWFNNELFTIVDNSDMDIVLHNDRLGAMPIPRTIFDDYFEMNHACNFYDVQGQTIKGRVIVHLDSLLPDYLTPDQRMRCLYVACSRVTNLDDLYFTYTDINELKDMKLSFCDIFGLGSSIKISQDDLVNKGCWSYELSLRVPDQSLCVLHTEKTEILKSIDDLKPVCGRIKKGQFKKLVLDYVKAVNNTETLITIAREVGITTRTLSTWLKGE
jgi:hypothetical protein